MRTSMVGSLVLLASIALMSACGGGGGSGGGPITVADLGGTWLGPTGTASPLGSLMAPAGTGGMGTDAAGNATGTGTLAGLTGTITLTDPVARLFRFTGTLASSGTDAVILVSADRNHMLFAASDGTFAAWERDAATLLPPYLDTDFRNSSWSGYAVEVDGAFLAQDQEPVPLVMIDEFGVFTAGPSATGTVPLSVFDADTGEIRGDFSDPGPPLETGNLLVLLTPDRSFVAILSCPSGAGSLTDCNLTALAR